jgi:hypothetical protein
MIDLCAIILSPMLRAIIVRTSVCDYFCVITAECFVEIVWVRGPMRVRAGEAKRRERSRAGKVSEFVLGVYAHRVVCIVLLFGKPWHKDKYRVTAQIVQTMFCHIKGMAASAPSGSKMASVAPTRVEAIERATSKRVGVDVWM